MLRPLLRTHVAWAHVAFQCRQSHFVFQRIQPAGPGMSKTCRRSGARLLSGQSGPPTPGNDAPNPIDDATEKAEEEDMEGLRSL